MKDERAIDGYFETLLDVSVPEHRKFLAEYKKRALPLPKNPKNINNNKNKGNQNKQNVLKPQNSTQNEKQFLAEKVNTKSTNVQSKSNAKNSNENTAASSGAKKKTKYVNLYGK